MALKPDRVVNPYADDITRFMSEVAEMGVIVTKGAGTNEGGYDDAGSTCVKAPSATGGEEPLGILMTDVVNLDLTKQHLNQHQTQTQVNGKVHISKYGTYKTNMIVTGDSPADGDAAHFTTDGELTSSVTTSVRVGTFRSVKDSDGYAKVDIRL